MRRRALTLNNERPWGTPHGKRKFGSAQIKDTRAWPYIFVGHSIFGDRRKICKFGVEGDTGRIDDCRCCRSHPEYVEPLSCPQISQSFSPPIYSSKYAPK